MFVLFSNHDAVHGIGNDNNGLFHNIISNHYKVIMKYISKRCCSVSCAGLHNNIMMRSFL